MVEAKFAVTHASGLLAEVLLKRMAQSGIKPESIVLLDQQQAGKRLSYGDTYLEVEDQLEYDYEDLTAVLLLEPDAELESLLQHADCYVISHHVSDMDQQFFSPGSSQVSNLPQPPCAIKLASAELSSLLLVIKTIHDNYKLSALNVVNVQSSAYYGKSGIDELASQTINLLNSREVGGSVFPLQLAFNMIPLEAVAEMEQQLPVALQSDDLKCSVQNILVPAFHGLCISVSLETTSTIDINTLSRELNEQQDVQVVNETVSPLTHCKSGSDILITGLHQPQKDINRLQFWVVADSVKNGLIQNYQNTLEILLKSFL